MNTTLLLMAEHGKAILPLEDVALRYLGLNDRVAKARAGRGELPFPAFQPGSQKGPWLVNIADLAAWLDAERDRAATECDKRRVA
jgi:hypothetical protein